MPEIGECYSISEKLKEHTGKVFKVEISERFNKYIQKGKFPITDIKGGSITKIAPYGKSIWFFGETKKQKFIITSQLGMSGSWFINDAMAERGHFHLKLLVGKTWLRYSDPRMFGKMNVYFGENFDELTKDVIKKHKWGIDPILSSEEEILSQFYKLQKTDQSIKIKLLEQNLIFGIGNYLASEILFDAKINPNRKSSSLTEPEFKTLTKSTKKWVLLAKKHNGFSFGGGYIMPDGSLGKGIEKYIQVYQKEGLPCPICKNKINKEFLATRATFYCSNCQK